MSIRSIERTPATLFAIGVSGRRVPVPERERLAIPTTVLQRVAAAIRAGGADEAAVLSTCHRTECYVVARGEQAALDAASRGLARVLGEDRLTRADGRVVLRGADAARHLLRVGCGLESQVLGDVQVIGQVRLAYDAAQSGRSVGAHLHRLFQGALAVAKRVRAETGISTGTVSVASASIELVARTWASLADLDLAIVGAGDTARKIAHHLAAERPRRLTVLNRTLERAAALAGATRAQARPLADLPEVLRQADVVWLATGAPGTILDAATVAGSVAARAGRPLVLVDLALPRDVEPAASSIDGVVLHDLDGLQSIVDGGRAVRAAALPDVERRIDDELARIDEWRVRREAYATVMA
jgi:glutamyl-tRNA reductase